MGKKINRELKTHGKVSFPFTIYGGKIPEYINSYPLHWHDELEIIYNVKGTGIITIDSKTYKLNNDDIIIVPPEIVHSISQHENDTMDYFTILFNLSLLSNNEKDICYEKYFKPIFEHLKIMPDFSASNDVMNKELTPYIKSLITNYNITSDSHELMVKSLLFAIMHIINKYSNNASNEDIIKRNTHDKLKDVLFYLQNNYELPITINDAAHISGFSESHFMKIFKQLTGKSFTQYLKEYRLEIAAHLLIETNLKIIDISEDIGFNNVSYFIRAFSNYYGLSPSAFRKKNFS